MRVLRLTAGLAAAPLLFGACGGGADGPRSSSPGSPASSSPASPASAAGPTDPSTTRPAQPASIGAAAVGRLCDRVPVGAIARLTGRPVASVEAGYDSHDDPECEVVFRSHRQSLDLSWMLATSGVDGFVSVFDNGDPYRVRRLTVDGVKAAEADMPGAALREVGVAIATGAGACIAVWATERAEKHVIHPGLGPALTMAQLRSIAKGVARLAH